MRLVAILHDCGKYISISDASDCSYIIIMSSEILGLSHKEREMVATVVSLNRKSLESYDSMADRFSVDEYMTIVKLLAILKVANALDRSHRQKFKNIKMAVRGNRLRRRIPSHWKKACLKRRQTSLKVYFPSVRSCGNCACLNRGGSKNEQGRRIQKSKIL